MEIIFSAYFSSLLLSKNFITFKQKISPPTTLHIAYLLQ